MSADPYSIDREARHDEGRSQREVVGIAGLRRLPVAQGTIPGAGLAASCGTIGIARKHLDREFAARSERSRAQAGTGKAEPPPYRSREDALRLAQVAGKREITGTILSL